MTPKTSLILVAWGVAVVAFFGQLVSYSAQPGNDGHPPVQWPDNSALQRNANQWTVLIFAHPRCPCTRSNIAEFARLQSKLSDTPTTHLVLFHPADQNQEWTKGPIRTEATRIDGLRLFYDEAGTFTRDFGVQTSGHILAYSPDGSLAYSGGLTSSRAHEGMSQGAIELLNLLNGKREIRLTEYPVFGCSIIDDEQACADEECKTP